ncbi:MAG: metal ABC transporter solute-binding protein, Zn/Mn family [Thermodesulfobacteriota bacterium]
MRLFGKTVSALFVWMVFTAGIAGAAEKIPVFVSIVPQEFFVQQIGKDRVDVQTMVRPGASPATYEPKPRQMAALTRAEVYFAVGVPFEAAWLRKIAAANPNMRVVHTEHGIEKIPMAAHHHDDPDDHANETESESHEHAHVHAHDHGIPDPHIWLSPPLVKKQARAILHALRDIDPENESFYEANFQEFAAEIDRLDADLKDTFAGKTGLQFMVFHPAWGYFARAYGLEQVPVEIEGKSPKPAQLKALIQHARNSGIKIVFVQPQFSSKSAELVAREIGGEVAFADPLARDWTANLRAVAEQFKSALQ